MNRPSHSLSSRLARLTMAVGLVLGLVLAAIEWGVDYDSRDREISQVVEAALKSAELPAMRAVETLDEHLAAEIVRGLLTYPFVCEASLIDETGALLARAGPGCAVSDSRGGIGLSRVESHGIPVGVRGLHTGGRLTLLLDRSRAMAPVVMRSMIMGVLTLVNCLLLGVVLFWLFFHYASRPLSQLAEAVRNIDPLSAPQAHLPELPGHEHDELGELVRSGNEVIGTVSDVMRRYREAQGQLRDSEMRLRLVVDTLPHFVFARDAGGRYCFVNRSLAKTYGLEPAEVIGYTPQELVPQVSQQPAHYSMELDREVIRDRRAITVPEVEYLDLDGTRRWLQVSKVPMALHGETVCLTTAIDITERRQADERIRQLATRDPLTGLINRGELTDVLSKELERSRRHGWHGALVFIDIDHFKTINDSLGHPTGDEVLQVLAEKMSTVLRSQDRVARVGGDEFVMVLSDLGRDQGRAALFAREVAERVRSAVAQPILIGERELRVSASIGIVLFPDDSHGVHDLLRYGDTALHGAKGAGRDTVRFFEVEMADAVAAQLDMESQLHRALRDEEFELFFQPQLAVNSNRIVGAEALLRWNHPERGLLAPGAFMAALENSNLVGAVGEWVLLRSCRTLRHWLDSGLWTAGQRLSVNVSARQFRETDFVRSVKEAASSVSLPVGVLELELTESALLDSVDDAVVKMAELREAGMCFALDDFGTGYSSMSYLKRLPVDVLKIDRSFVSDVHDPSGAAIVSAILAMASALGREVVAEGVETEPQRAFLLERGCERYQGFLYSPAVPAMAFEKMLRHQLDG